MSRPRIQLETYSGRTARRLMRKRANNGRALKALAILGVVTAVGALGAWAWAGLDLGNLGLGRASAGDEPRSVPSTVTSRPPTITASTVPSTPSAEPTVASGPATITISAVGDILFDRKVKTFIQAQGGEAPLAGVAERLSAADITFGNLETVIGTTGKKVANKEFTFRGHPAAIKGLKLAGFDAISLANNHTLDYGPEPLKETITALDGAGIGYAGAGPDTDAAWTPAIIERSGTKTAFLAFTHVIPPGFLAGKNRWGVASGRMDPKLTDKAIKAAKKNNDYVIVSFHWGIELEDNANATQVQWAHRAIDSGADMVLAHHPHVIQGVEFYRGRLIAYSLGDFVWDYGAPKGGESFILEAELGPNGVSNAVAVPVRMNKQTGRPDIVAGERAKDILQRLKTISKKHGTTVKVSSDHARLLP